MSINSTFYLDAADLATATAVYLDSSLIYPSPDGFYGDGTITRQQSSGILLAAEACETCATPCGGLISATGGEGVYQINLNAGTATGAITIKFDPGTVPDGIRVVYDSVVYNKLSSPVGGVHQSTTYGDFTVIGASASDCGLNGNTTNFPSLTEYIYNGTSFVATGNTQSITVLPGDVSLGVAPEQCVMVIPKTTSSPNVLLIEILGPCAGTSWDIETYCPFDLPPFASSDMYGSASILCTTPIENQYFFARVHTTVDSYVDLYDYVFTDKFGEFPLADGFYLTDNVAAPNKVIEVSNGVIIGITNCV